MKSVDEIDWFSRFPTHYGQVCCYDDTGHLMQTSYQPVIKVTPDVPYNPGFPTRAYEFGTSPYMGQFEVCWELLLTPVFNDGIRSGINNTLKRQYHLMKS